MTWESGPCLPAPGPPDPATDQALRALLSRLEEPDRDDELATRRRQRAPWTTVDTNEHATPCAPLWAVPQPPDLRDAFAHAPAALAVTTPAGTITATNTAFVDLLGRDPASLIGSTLREVTHPDDLPDDLADAQSVDTLGLDALVPAGGPVPHGTRRLRRADGQVIWAALTATPLPAAGRPAHLVVHLADITEHRRSEADLRHRALHDPLTGLANRALLLDRVSAAIAQLDRRGRPSHVFFLDLDGFKPVNDRYGHTAGDTVLAQLAKRLTLLTRVGDTAARIGGDEFAILCEDTPPGLADTIAGRLRAAAAQPFHLDHDTTVTLSASVGACPVHGKDPREVLREADERMYAAKRRGINYRRNPTSIIASTSRFDRVTGFPDRNAAGDLGPPSTHPAEPAGGGT